ncbi:MULTISPECIES: VWA domain-containing protein [Microbacterium]|uniref:VWA domain-containing protein n=1 Tax=Microbacterium TaxID=33882 RepID=UPI0013A540AF|nr:MULTISPECIES: VWA domain-containing protein [Microbacterium]
MAPLTVVAIVALVAVGLPSGALADEVVAPAPSTTPTPTDTPTEPPDDTATDPATVESEEPSPTEVPADPPHPEAPAPSTAPEDAPPGAEPVADDDSTQIEEPALDAAEPTDVGVFAVPAPGAGEAVITVRTGDTRSQSDPNAIAPLAGVQLGLFTTLTGGTQLFTCTADAEGDCSFVVPDTGDGGVNRDREMYVRQIAPPAGTFTNPQLRTGDAFGGDNQATSYSFRVGQNVGGTWQVRAGSTYTTTPPAEFMVSSGNTNRIASGGVWQTSRNNPVLPQQCGLDIALVMDLSGSVNPSIVAARDAAKTLVNSMVGTPSRIGLFTFAQSAPANNTNNQNRPITAVSTAAGAATVNGWIDGLTAPTNGTTNWDRGLYQVATAATSYDVLIILTDGNPTVYGTESAPGNFTRVREVENAVFSANAVKAEGTRIVALGVGSGVSAPQTALNLRAISGGNAYNGSNSASADYYQTADYAAAGDAMRQLALGNCQGSVSVVKQVVPPSGDLAAATPAGGWAISATAPTAGIAIGTPNPADGLTAAGTGSISFPLDYTGGTTDGTVTIRETQQAGFTLLPQGGVNAVCRDLNTNALIPGVTNAPTVDGQPGVVVPVSPSTAASCVFFNRQPNPPAELVVDKLWVVNGAPAVPHGSQDPSLSANASVNGVTTGFGDTTGGLSAGQSVPVNENVGTLPTLCTLNSRLVTAFNGAPADFDLAAGDYSAVLAAGTNTVQITNTVTCPTRLTLLKDVDGDGVPTNLWTLDALTPPGGAAFPAGNDSGSGVTGDVTPGLVYPLAESGGDPRYIQVDNRDPVLSVPGSTGSWACVPRDANGNPTGGNAGGLNGGVIVGFGTWVQCTAVNQTARLTLLKEIQPEGGAATPATWDLTATPQGPPIPGLDPQTVKSGTQISIRPGTAYVLSESDVPGYIQQSLQCDVGNGFVDATSVTLPPNGVGTCRFVNAPIVIEHDKSVVAGSVTQGADGTWTIQYRIDVINSGTVAAPYSLSDDLHFGAGNDTGGATYTVAVNGNPGPLPWSGSGPLATGRTLGAGSTDVWLITVSGIAVTGPDLTPAQTACPQDDSDGAFNNAAVLTVAGVPTTDTACDAPSAPTVEKSGATAVQNPDATWDVTYTITVSNTAPGAKPSFYSLTDDPGFPAEVTLNSYRIDAGASVSPVPAIIPVVSDQPIAAGETDVYTITINATVPAGLPAGERECDVEQGPGAGFFNEIELTSGDIVREDVDCTEIEEGGRPTVEKSDPTVVQGGDGVWTLVYDLTVTGNAEFVSTYTLSDTLNFGGAIDVLTASWTGEGDSGSWADPATTPTEVIVGPVPKAIGIDAVHDYTVTVTAAVDADAFEDPTTLTCDATEGEPDVGFLNTATLTSDGVPQTDTGCGIPARPIITKETDGTVVKVDDHFEASYTITVANGSADQEVVYDLQDVPDFSGAVQVIGREVTSGDVTVNPAWNGASPTSHMIVEDETLPGGATHSFTVTVSFTVQLDGAGPGLLCEGEGGQGLLNTATVVSGGEWSDDACHDVPVVVEILKEWIIDGGEPIAWDDPDLPAGYSAQGTIDGVNVDWGVEVGPYALGDEVNVDETDVIVPESCSIVNTGDNGTGLKELTATVNSFTVTNEVECPEYDVMIEKSYELEDGETAVEAGDEFEWVLTVTNLADPVNGLTVTDLIDPALEVAGPATFDPAAGWTQDSGPTDSAFEATFTGVFASDAVAEIRIPVRMLPEPPIDAPPAVDPSAPPPQVPPLDESPIPNEACVALVEPQPGLASPGQGEAELALAQEDIDPSNNCDDSEVPVKRISAGAYVRCIADVPWLYFDVQTTSSVEPGEITITWTSADGTLTRVDTVPWEERDGRLLWPGAAVNDDGIPYQFPGWRPVTEADLADPASVVPGTRFLDLILDETDATFPWRGETYTPSGDPANPYTVTKEPLSVEFSINPSQTVLAVYPQALPTCAIDRPPLLDIEKTASTTSAKPGSSFEYTLQVTSTGEGAAEPVTLFDEIPDDLRVDAITTAPAPAFPRWENCAVTGADSAGFGGSLRCDLLGVLGPNITAAPPVTLDVTLRSTTRATSIVNTGEVCYEDADGVVDGVFCAEDNVTVTVPQPLPATGSTGGDWLWLGVGLIVLGGLSLLFVARRRSRTEAAD